MKLARYMFTFVAGFLFSFALLVGFSGSVVETPFSSALAEEAAVPSDWISEEDISFFDNGIFLDIENVKLSRYADTGSMVPTFGSDSNGLVVVPESEDEISVGDIITFSYGDLLIVHRVVVKGEDSEGVYFVTKGDSNNFTDGKIRFEDIKHVLVGVLY